MQKRFAIADLFVFFNHTIFALHNHWEQIECQLHPSSCTQLYSTKTGVLVVNSTPPGSQHILTLRQQHKGLIQGLFTKSILDISAAKSEDNLLYPRVDSVHNPNRRICKFNGRSGSGDNYKLAVLSIRQYAVGSKETFWERQYDFRRSNGSTPNILWSDYLQQRSFQAILPWID